MKKPIPILLLIILFGAAAWYSFVKQPEAVHELPPPSLLPAAPEPVTEQVPPPATEGEDIIGYREPEPVYIPDPLPRLKDSDPAIRQDLAELVGADPLAEYLVKNQAISRLVATLDSLTSRQVPALINPVKPVGGKFVVDSGAERVTLSARNFARYDAYVELLQNTETAGLVGFYRHYGPLFQLAWEENGGEGAFNDRVLEVIDHLLETPDVPGPVYLTKPEAVYLFEEPELEAMTAGQKILVRMGSANASVVKEKLRDIKRNISTG